MLLKNDASSRVMLTVSKYVGTEYDDCYGVDCYQNEKRWLRELAGTGATPAVVAFDDAARRITTEYAGAPVSRATLPANWQAQGSRLLEVLRQHNCRHNDIKPSEILVLNGRMRLVDFGWASELDRPLPPTFPPELGLSFRCKTGPDDRYSFMRSIAHSARSLRPPPRPRYSPPRLLTPLRPRASRRVPQAPGAARAAPASSPSGAANRTRADRDGAAVCAETNGRRAFANSREA